VETGPTDGFYARWILPALLDWAMRQRPLERYRRQVLPSARGRVLEIGVGSGLNLPLYGGGVDVLVGLDPSARLLSMARGRAARTGVRTRLIRASATRIPFADDTVDTVVLTWTLCSLPDPGAALREMERVLRRSGALLFVEHGLSPGPTVREWQHRLTPLWRRFAGGCHLDRKIDDLIRDAGFELAELRTEYAPGPRPLTYTYMGAARPVAARSR
jgi:ubiquinone/menaquinone biosynthesis C-methylase UbiE